MVSKLIAGRDKDIAFAAAALAAGLVSGERLRSSLAATALSVEVRELALARVARLALSTRG